MESCAPLTNDGVMCPSHQWQRPVPLSPMMEACASLTNDGVMCPAHQWRSHVPHSPMMEACVPLTNDGGLCPAHQWRRPVPRSPMMEACALLTNDGGMCPSHKWYKIWHKYVYLTNTLITVGFMLSTFQNEAETFGTSASSVSSDKVFLLFLLFFPIWQR